MSAVAPPAVSDGIATVAINVIGVLPVYAARATTNGNLPPSMIPAA